MKSMSYIDIDDVVNFLIQYNFLEYHINTGVFIIIIELDVAANQRSWKKNLIKLRNNTKSNANLIHLGLPTRKTQKSQTQMSHVHQNGRKLICTNLVLLIGRLPLQIFHKMENHCLLGAIQSFQKHLLADSIIFKSL